MMCSAEGNVVIANCVDDPHLVREAESETKREGVISWWDEQMSSRLNNPRVGSYVVVHQRVNERDLIGHLLRKASPIPWVYFCLPAEFEPDHPHRWIRDPRTEAGELLWPQHQDRGSIDALKMALGPYATAGQLQQRPSPRSGGIFKREWFPTVRNLPADMVWVRGWDLAATEKQLVKSDPDFTVGAKVGWSMMLGKWIIGDIQRFRKEAHDVERTMLDVATADSVETQIQLPQDPGAAGKGQAQNLIRLLSRFTVYAAPVTGDKMARALKWAAKAGSGLVALLDGPWNDDFLAELTSFPTGAHDDQVDAVSSAFDRLLNSDNSVADWIVAQLRARGIDPASLQTPRQRVAEEQAREQALAAQRSGDAAADPGALARAMAGRGPTQGR